MVRGPGYGAIAILGSRGPLPGLYIGGRVSRIYKSPIASMLRVSLFKPLSCRTSLGLLVFESVPMIWTPRSWAFG